MNVPVVTPVAFNVVTLVVRPCNVPVTLTFVAVRPWKPDEPVAAKVPVVIPVLIMLVAVRTVIAVFPDTLNEPAVTVVTFSVPVHVALENTESPDTLREPVVTVEAFRVPVHVALDNTESPDTLNEPVVTVVTFRVPVHVALDNTESPDTLNEPVVTVVAFRVPVVMPVAFSEPVVIPVHNRFVIVPVDEFTVVTVRPGQVMLVATRFVTVLFVTCRSVPEPAVNFRLLVVNALVPKGPDIFKLVVDMFPNRASVDKMSSVFTMSQSKLVTVPDTAFRDPYTVALSQARLFLTLIFLTVALLISMSSERILAAERVSRTCNNSVTLLELSFNTFIEP